MRVSELSSRTGVPVPTIKYYLREGLLAPGVATSANQSSYSDEHVRRLALIRALVDLGGLSIATVGDVIAAIDDPDMPLSYVFGIAQLAISDTDLHDPLDEADPHLATVDALTERMGWTVSADNPGRMGVARVLEAYERAGHPELAEIWDGYARGAELIAQADLASVQRQHTVADMAETVVVGTVLGDAMLTSLRRMVQEHESYRLFPAQR